jgi:hypothetical protein
MRSCRRCIAKVGLLLLVGCSGAGENSGAEEPGRPQTRQHRAVWLFYDSAATNASDVAAAITRAGGRVRYVSRWLHAVSAEIAPGRMRRLANITRVQPVGVLYSTSARSAASPRVGFLPTRFSRSTHSNLRSACPAQLRPAPTDSATYGRNFGALRELGVPQAHALGFTGRGVRIAIIDTGFDTDHESLIDSCISFERDLINGDTNVGNEAGDGTGSGDQELHGTRVWSILGAYEPGELVGPAYGAEFVLLKVDAEPLAPADSIDEDRWVRAVEWAGDSAQVDIINSSLAYRDFRNKSDYTASDLDGRTTVATRAAAEAARRGILLVTAVGNTTTPATRSSLFAPADADSVLAVGAIDALRQPWANSARGPSTGNANVKPELVARGIDVHAARASGTYDQGLAGTSLATPFVAGIAALFMEAWPNAKAMWARNALILSGSNVNPDTARGLGYGVPNVASAIAFPEGIKLDPFEPDRDGIGAITSITPHFAWNGEPVHPTVRPRYHLELATDPQFNNIFYRDSTAANQITVTRRPLRPLNAFWWRIIAVDSARPTLRDTSSTGGPFSVPSWVTLSPLPEFVNTTHPEFSWAPKVATPPVSLEYDLQIINHTTNQVVQTLANITDARAEARQALTANSSYRWRVIARAVGVSPVLADTVESVGHFVVTSSLNPPTTTLYPSFPNPFPRNSENITRFWFDLARPSAVELTIHDIRGRLVRSLVPGTSDCPTSLPAGQYGRGAEPCKVLLWDGRNESGQLVPRGVYIARLRAGATVSTQRILYLPNR